VPEVVDDGELYKFTLYLLTYLLRDCSCAPILRFFSVASDGATAEPISEPHFLVNFFTSLRKDSDANYASIWTVYSPSVIGPDLLCNAPNISHLHQ